MLNKVKRHVIVLLVVLVLAVIIMGKIYYTNSNNKFLYFYGLTVTSVVFFTFFIAHFRYVDPSESLRRKGLNSKIDKPFVSCIFAVYNDDIVVRNCIESLINSSYKNKEIIVINDSSTDKTKEVLERYRKYPEMKIINLEKNVGKKKAIAEGIKVAKGDIFVFTDSDSVVAKDAIERIIEIFVCDEDVGAVSGHGRALNAEENLLTRIQDSWYETQFSIEKAFESSYGAVSCVSGPLAVFRKEAIYNYIPAWVNDSFLGKEFRFATDRQLTGYVLGSRYIDKKLKQKYSKSPFVRDVNYPPRKWKVLYCKSAKVWTTVPNEFNKLIKQHVRWKKSFIRNLFFTGSFYWREPLAPSIKFYLGALFTIVGPIIAIRHLVYLPLTGSSLSGVYYLGGIMFIGSLYGVMFKMDNPKSRVWIYRPLMSVLSTLVLSWLLFYSLITIRKGVWHRG